jgi:hypothetical protein
MDAKQVTDFCNSYWSHPYYRALEEKGTAQSYIRIRALPSAWAKKNSAENTKIGPQEFVIFRSTLSSRITKILQPLNERGYDIYYFVNPVGVGITHAARDSDVSRRLWLLHDFDIELPRGVMEIYDDFGIAPPLVI